MARKALKSQKKAEKTMAKRLMMFDMLDDECAACLAPFDKQSKEHAMTWNVVVREQEKVVRLYCPECWDKAQSIIKQVENQTGEDNEGSE